LHRLLILYDYFDPAFKAGGPIRSLVNLVRLMDQELEIFVLTTNQDHDGEVLDIQADQWMPYGEKAKVMYLAAGNRGYKNIQNAIDHVRPDTVYFNGMYSIPLLVFPLQILKKRKEVKIVIAPRGMLQSGIACPKTLEEEGISDFFEMVLVKQEDSVARDHGAGKSRCFAFLAC
jgi:hypothetical protein